MLRQTATFTTTSHGAVTAVHASRLTPSASHANIVHDECSLWLTRCKLSLHSKQNEKLKTEPQTTLQKPRADYARQVSRDLLRPTDPSDQQITANPADKKDSKHPSSSQKPESNQKFFKGELSNRFLDGRVSNKK